MDRKNLLKTLRYALVGTSGLSLGGMALLPAVAFAQSGKWDPSGILKTGGKDAGVEASDITAETVQGWVGSIVNWAIGIFVAFFVLRIALTAFDRMVLANMPTTAHVPLAYPNPGDERYDPGEFPGQAQGWTWKRIFVNFAKNIAIVAGAWVIVQVIMGLVVFFFGAFGKKS